MLSRSAQGLYWMGRYLERARHLSRLLQLQSEALVDRPVREIYFGWRRIYASVGRAPPGGSLEVSDDDDFVLADSFTLVDDLTFERLEPRVGVAVFLDGQRERPADAQPHKRGDVDVTEPVLSTDPKGENTGHLGHIPTRVLCGDDC